MHVSAADAALVSSIFNPPRARRPWSLTDVLPAGSTRIYSLARWALVDAFRAAGVGRGDQVLLPGLICKEVLAAVHALGAVATFYPVSRHLRASLADAGGAAKAVVAVHYFGFPQDLEPFRDYCARAGATLIEDNAHGLFSRDGSGQLLGSRGDAAIFSFRKTLAVRGGAALVLRGDSVLPEREAVPAQATGVHYQLKQACRPFAAALGPVTTLRLAEGVARVRGLLAGRPLSQSAADSETRIPLGPNPPAQVLRDITVADPDLESRRRRSLYELVACLTASAGVDAVFPEVPALVVPYGFPFLARPAQVPEIRAQMAGHGLPLAHWPDLPAAIVASAPEHYRRLMVVPFLW